MPNHIGMNIQPRLISSIKWSLLPVDLQSHIREAFELEYKTSLPTVKWHISGRIYPEEVVLHIGYGHSNDLKQNHFYVSTQIKSDQKTTEIIYSLVDILHSILSENLTSNHPIELPRQWKKLTSPPCQFEVYFYYSTENFDLENQADLLLGQDDTSSLVTDTEEPQLEIQEAQINLPNQAIKPYKH